MANPSSDSPTQCAIAGSPAMVGSFFAGGRKNIASATTATMAAMQGSKDKLRKYTTPF